MCCSCLNEHNKALSHRARRVRGDQAHLNPPSLISLDRKTQNPERFFFRSLSTDFLQRAFHSTQFFFDIVVFMCLLKKKKRNLVKHII